MSAPKATTERFHQERSTERPQGLEGTMAQIAASVEALAGRQAKPSVRPVAAAQPREAAHVVAKVEVSGNIAREISTATQKLHIAAREVVEAMDGSLPRDLEKRYSAGDKGVYTQRLHDNRGKRAVKALAARYIDERLLRSRINGYIRIFERLLDSLSDTPGSTAMLDDVLNSENGEVYLMLAETAGRVPEA